MSASTSKSCNEWDQLPTDGAQAWVGMLLIVGSGAVSLRALGWVVKTIGSAVMQ